MLRSALRIVFVLACATVLAVSSARAQDARSARVDGLFAHIGGRGAPGCAAGVVHDGRLVHERGYGIANLDYGVPIDGRSVFYLASLSKQFTAASVALAASEGRLSLDDDIRKYIPELPDYGTRITVRHLVHHTSGLRDYLTLIPMAGKRADDHWTDEALLRLIVQQRALNFPPGTEFLYSNTGYVLLAEIVQRATGRSLRQYAEEKLFRPLGMRDTHFHDDAREVVPRRAVGYVRDSSGWRMNHWFAFDKVGDGGLYSTVQDLAKWDENFYSGRVGGRALLTRLHERGVLASGDSLGYAFGLVLNTYRGLPIVEHGGSLAAFRTNMLRVPSERFTAIVLCNSPVANPPLLSRRIADIYLEHRMRAPAQETANGGARPAAAQAASGAAPAPPVNLRDFAGRYHSEELDADYMLEMAGDTLIARRADGSRLTLRAIGADEFTTPPGAVLRFRRTADSVTGFTIDAGRVRGIVFARVP